jgi:ABC-2 type transport system permease protein
MAAEAPAGEAPAGEAPAGEAGRPPLLGQVAHISLASRLYGFGSIYAKTMRDSRLAVLIVGGLTIGLMVFGWQAIGAAFPDAKARQDMAKLVNDLPPIMKGLGGNPVNIDRIGGYISWKYGPFFALVVGLWSIVALSGTLAAEARKGSLDVVAASPFGKRRIAIEKLAAHVTGMVLIMAALVIVTAISSSALAVQAADRLPVSDSIGFGLWLGLIGLVSGSVAWALAPFLGRASAAGIAGALLLGGYVISGYQAAVPALQPLAHLTWFYWTYNEVPLAGQSDWPSLIPVAIVAVVLFVIGIEAFQRRDLGVSSAIPVPAMPGALLGTMGPTRRAFGERLPTAIAWGIGLAIYAALIAASSRSFADELRTTPDVNNLLKSVFPTYDVASAGGFLQLMFAYLGFVVAGLAAATLVSGWSSDEGDRRLELLLASPLGRARWAIAGGIGVFGAIAVMTGLAMLGVALGVASAGGDMLTPVAGGLIIGLYAAAAAGVGMAVGGLFRNTIAGELTAVFVIATFLIDFLAPPLNLPDWVHQLALSSHLGQTLVGHWDLAGVAACLALAVGGLLLGAWGMTRRDVA